MTERDKAVRKFRRAAEQRWLTAHFLLTESEYYLDSVYLGGYAVECSLKALILTRTPPRSFSAMYEEITSGKKAHDFEFLKSLLQRKPVNLTVSKSLASAFRKVASWSTDLRYEAKLFVYDEAKDFLQAAALIRKWADEV